MSPHIGSTIFLQHLTENIHLIESSLLLATRRHMLLKHEPDVFKQFQESVEQLILALLEAELLLYGDELQNDKHFSI